eukprot:m.165920 g.165920  ORF g.165920 m.165920 type:complete len:185 (-) comp53129_c0_seq2:128-682(-)
MRCVCCASRTAAHVHSPAGLCSLNQSSSKLPVYDQVDACMKFDSTATRRQLPSVPEHVDQVDALLKSFDKPVAFLPYIRGRKRNDPNSEHDFSHIMSNGYQHDFVQWQQAREATKQQKERAMQAHLHDLTHRELKTQKPKHPSPSQTRFVLPQFRNVPSRLAPLLASPKQATPAGDHPSPASSS